MCGAHAAVRTLVSELVDQNDRPTVVDMEAGLEHFSRGTIRNVDTALLIVEPYFKSMETGARMSTLARELEIARVLTVANKVRGAADSRALADFCSKREMHLLAEIPFDEALLEAERAGRSPLDFSAASPALRALDDLARALTSPPEAASR